nr:IS3 family transposase [Thermanaeromonas sp.]
MKARLLAVFPQVAVELEAEQVYPVLYLAVIQQHLFVEGLTGRIYVRTPLRAYVQQRVEVVVGEAEDEDARVALDSRRVHERRVYPYLLRSLSITYPNQVWGIDITYIRLVRGWMYLVAIMDWYSRFVVSWALDQCLETAFVLVAVKEAIAKAKPEIMNSDQGAQFTDPDYIKLLEGAGIRISMDGRGQATDNIFTERLWRSLKYEEVYLNEYESPREARQGISRYLEFYNYRRPHQSLGYRTPAEVYYGKG